jgi:hypothetical protein
MASKVYRYKGQTIYFRQSISPKPCVLCNEDIKKKQLQVKEKGKYAHFRCAYPEAYEERYGAVHNNLSKQRYKPKLGRVTRIA